MNGCFKKPKQELLSRISNARQYNSGRSEVNKKVIVE